MAFTPTALAPAVHAPGTLWLMTGEPLVEGSFVDEGPGSAPVAAFPSAPVAAFWPMLAGFWPHPLPSVLFSEPPRTPRMR